MKFLSAGIMESKDIGNCSNNGISARFKQVYFEHPRGYIDPEHAPVEQRVTITTSRGYIKAKPSSLKSHSMMGGTFIYSSDSRFREVHPYPIPLHDRVEN